MPVFGGNEQLHVRRLIQCFHNAVHTAYMYIAYILYSTERIYTVERLQGCKICRVCTRTSKIRTVEVNENVQYLARSIIRAINQGFQDFCLNTNMERTEMWYGKKLNNMNTSWHGTVFMYTWWVTFYHNHSPVRLQWYINTEF